jgi:acetyl esterase/lipase
MKFHRDSIYGSEHERQKLDVMLPEGDGPFPVVVAIHGGGWREGSKDGDMPKYGKLFVQFGLAVVIPNYRLSGTHPHPAQERDIFSVLDWIAKNGASYKLDPRRVGLTGVSAGAHLAGLVGVKAAKASRANSGCAVRCLLPVCGVFDIARWFADKPAYRDYMEDFLGGTMESSTAAMRDASPVHHVHSAAPPCLTVHGAQDEVVPCNQSALFVETLKKVGASAESVIVPQVGHAAFMPDDPTQPLGGTEIFHAFFRKHLLA